MAAQQHRRNAKRIVFDIHQLILDFDGKDDRVQGEHNGQAFNSNYGGYGFFSLYVYFGEKLLIVTFAR